MLRVLHCVAGMGRGGVETTLMNIFRNIDRNLIQFDFLVTTKDKCDYDDEILSLGGRIHYVPSRKQGIMKSRKALYEFFSVHKEYKIVHQHVSSLSNIEAIKAAKRAGVPVRIIHSRNTQQSGSKLHKYLHLWNQRDIQSYATDYFACSDLAAKWLYGEKQFTNGNYKIINNGIQSDKFVFNSEMRDRLRKELGVEQKLVIGNVGRFNLQKNHMFLLDVFKSVNDANPNSLLLLIGDGALRGCIEDKIEELGLNANVILTGVRSDISDLLQAMDIFVMPSFYEGLPGTVIEAQGAGLPCLISDTITNEVHITDLVHYASLEDTAEKWRDIILNMTSDFHRRDTQSELVEAGFDMKSIAKELQEYYIDRITKI
ncbi:glycosyltransferase family 1 protein [Niallia oryzisoli]|uniref:glycosyltransferase family 1 protein n=1 Tax=Niallia oryzisoli TaxID=1737571 RepID=UPI003736C746